MQKEFESDLKTTFEFIKHNSLLSEFSLNGQQDAVVIQAKIKNGSKIKWDFIGDVFHKYFSEKHGVKVKLLLQNGECEQKPSTDKLANDAEWKSPRKGVGSKQFSFISTDEEYRLFRFTPDTSVKNDPNYFAACETLVSDELKSLDRKFLFAADDVRKEKYVRNIIEININCILDKRFLEKYLFAFRQIPKQLRDRFAISFVRIDPSLDISQINKAVEITSGLVHKTLLSVGFDSFKENIEKYLTSKASGVVITVGKIKNIEDTGLLIDIVTIEEELIRYGSNSYNVY